MNKISGLLDIGVRRNINRGKSFQSIIETLLVRNEGLIGTLLQRFILELGLLPIVDR
jgi:hypothetical protein